METNYRATCGLFENYYCCINLREYDLTLQFQEKPGVLPGFENGTFNSILM